MPLDYDMLMRLPAWEIRQDYTRRDTILYALGAGAGIEPRELDFVYEPRLQALPSIAAVLTHPGFWQKDPKYGLTWQKLLHGEQWLRVHRPIPVEGSLKGEMRIEEIYDKGADKGAVLLWKREISDAGTGEAIATVRGSSFLRADGGFGGQSTGAPAPHPIPQRPADRIVELGTRPEQALIYRLSGDYNPLHADPEVAKAAGFDRPILHGLCSYAIACRAIVMGPCGGDAARLRSLDARFSAPVFPGETLSVEIWNDGAFRVTVVERGLVAINNGYFEHD
ncbi:MaoC/PaaZ C-terminal domain-containing protein [Sphingosinicella ginsenosidimutans]|uniref:3-alpha,7-alpha, 12-alpha-trihydroxy-5-beta-cholest-24-enoyl-CoA hydratase n=1 Tax=Allosphingosinicella ginsenosidimutans TaxID=1176539 RepID=A0A5C6TRK0_9SPHN|nr:MaoC/PaaZ C-terminal domain-containing protein [Sphingosinicella ginsenosidimutans]TXC62575.1 3-alpha,7-alpha,12-alpha-trihydroxy-5-beta-cholest-24-enoyl-CoA hydratase [Sphingosinicella ginsenosidimutans]